MATAIDLGRWREASKLCRWVSTRRVIDTPGNGCCKRRYPVDSQSSSRCANIRQLVWRSRRYSAARVGEGNRVIYRFFRKSQWSWNPWSFPNSDINWMQGRLFEILSIDTPISISVVISVLPRRWSANADKTLHRPRPRNRRAMVAAPNRKQVRWSSPANVIQACRMPKAIAGLFHWPWESGYHGLLSHEEYSGRYYHERDSIAHRKITSLQPIVKP